MLYIYESIGIRNVHKQIYSLSVLLKFHRDSNEEKNVEKTPIKDSYEKT